MRESITGHGGTVISTEGDSVFAVFPSAREAIAGAIDALRALDAHAWPTAATVNVRVGIHAAEAVLDVGGANYTGLEVHRTARIMAAAHGGQVLVSDSARTLAGDALPAGATFLDLGRISSGTCPPRNACIQLAAQGLRERFPPPRTLTIVTPTNLPATLTRFVGRTQELADVRALLQANRLVTLTGPGGSGKTRLSIETARTLPRRLPRRRLVRRARRRARSSPCHPDRRAAPSACPSSPAGPSRRPSPSTSPRSGRCSSWTTWSRSSRPPPTSPPCCGAARRSRSSPPAASRCAIAGEQVSSCRRWRARRAGHSDGRRHRRLGRRRSSSWSGRARRVRTSR